MPSLLYAQVNDAADKKKIVVVGGHPDNPECGCAGTVARLVNSGHAITLMYLTTGEEVIRRENMGGSCRYQEKRMY